MGIFGNILNKVGNGLRAVGRGVGKFVEGFGEITGIDFIENAGRSIQDFCSERISMEASYDSQAADIYSTKRLTEILVSFSDGYLDYADGIEETCIREVENCYDDFIQLLEQAMEEGANKAGLKRLKSAKGRIRRTIKGSIRTPLARRMSLDDAECLRILEMDSGTEKRDAMKRFTQRVIREALKNTADQVRLSLDEQLEDIEDYLTGIQEEQQKGLNALKEQYDAMVAKGDQEASDREQACLEPMIVLEEIRLAEALFRA